MTGMLRNAVALLALAGAMLAGPAVTPARAVVELPPEVMAMDPAARGYWILLNLPLGPPTLTETEYFDLWKAWPEPWRTEAERASPDERRKLLLSRYGFQETADRDGFVPQQFTPDGDGRLSDNCLFCHGGPVDGKVVRGLGNGLVDIATFAEDLAALRKADGTAQAAYWPANVPSAPESPVRGLSNAWGTAIAFVMMREKDLTRTEVPQFPIPAAAQFDLPGKTPPYWLSKRKSHYYADAFAGKSHRDIMQFSMTFAVSKDAALALEAPFRDIYAWIDTLEAPPYPGPVDRDAARRGRLVYLQNCVACHGLGSNFPDRVVSLAEVGTDPVRAVDLPVAFKTYLGESWFGDYGQTSSRPETGGYLAQPLDGVWASAPYLHNGSVPTIWHLLTPEARPAIWTREDHGYDHARLGVVATAHAEMPKEVTDPRELRRYYRTTLRGLGNGGHAFPAGGLPEADKMALIEFLKTL
ncbi:MAG: cytochrome c [Sneathiellaceae bacterium]